jgi:hypothetical protein
MVKEVSTGIKYKNQEVFHTQELKNPLSGFFTKSANGRKQKIVPANMNADMMAKLTAVLKKNNITPPEGKVLNPKTGRFVKNVENKTKKSPSPRYSSSSNSNSNLNNNNNNSNNNSNHNPFNNSNNNNDLIFDNNYRWMFKGTGFNWDEYALNASVSLPTMNAPSHTFADVSDFKKFLHSDWVGKYMLEKKIGKIDHMPVILKNHPELKIDVGVTKYWILNPFVLPEYKGYKLNVNEINNKIVGNYEIGFVYDIRVSPTNDPTKTTVFTMKKLTPLVDKDGSWNKIMNEKIQKMIDFIKTVKKSSPKKSSPKKSPKKSP